MRGSNCKYTISLLGPIFSEEFFAFMLSVKESDAEREKQTEQQAK